MDRAPLDGAVERRGRHAGGAQLAAGGDPVLTGEELQDVGAVHHIRHGCCGAPGREIRFRVSSCPLSGQELAQNLRLDRMAQWRRELDLSRPPRPGAQGDGGPGRRRVAGVRRPRPAVPVRVRGDAAGAPDDARRAPRRRRHDGDPAARGAAGRRAARCVHAAPVGRDRGPDGDRRPPRRRRGDRRGRRPDVGPVPRPAAAADAGHRVPPRRRRRRPAADGQGRRRDRRAARPPARPPTGSPTSCTAGRSRSSGGPRPRSRPTSRRA